jgi:hypothetical protein
MKAKHTPGPWVVFGCLDRFPGIEAADLSIVIWGDKHDESGVKGETHEESIANANLIAAAPDLLEALEGIITTMPDLEEFENPDGYSMLPFVAAARSAIAKAKGETP